MSFGRFPAARTTFRLASSIRAAAVPFVVTRVLTLGALGLAWLVVHPLGLVHGSKAAGTVRAGLLGWDASYYRRIAAVGYGAVPGGERFFPLFPLTVRWLAWLPGVSAGAAAIILANLFGFAALVALHGLVASESLERHAGRRAIWALSLWPAAFVLVMGYAESLFLLLSVLAFWCWRQGRWWLSVVPALLAGLCRPAGLILVVPALVEAVGGWRRASRSPHMPRPSIMSLVGRAAGVLAAPGGTAIYLGWALNRVSTTYLGPLRAQLSSVHRGGITDPVVTFARDARDLVTGHHLGTAMHAVSAVVFIGLALYVLVRLPLAYGAYAVATLIAVLTAANLDSLERYGLACFPLAVGVGLLVEHRRVRWIVFPIMAAILAGLATLAFLGRYVP